MSLTDTIWMIVAFVLTLLVFSYIFGDNFLFRMVSYIFVGVTAGYLVSVLVYQVLWPRLVFPLMHGGWEEKILAAIPLGLSVLLLARVFPRWSPLGRIPLAYLVGIGAAVTIGGAVIGTLFGQIGGVFSVFNLPSNSTSANPFGQVMQGIYILVGTVATLMYFQFSSRVSKDGQPKPRSSFLEFMALLGKLFISITLGALLAGVLVSSLSALIERVDFLYSFFQGLM